MDNKPLLDYDEVIKCQTEEDLARCFNKVIAGFSGLRPCLSFMFGYYLDQKQAIDDIMRRAEELGLSYGETFNDAKKYREHLVITLKETLE